MRKRVVFVSTIALALWLLIASAQAQVSVVTSSGVAPFVYQNRTYVAVRDAADFIGAQVVWNDVTKEAHVLRGQRELVLGPDQSVALDAGQPVAFEINPLIISGQIFVPIQLLSEFFDFPVEWDAEARQPRVFGPNGWGNIAVEPPPWGTGIPPWLEEKQLYQGPPRHGPGQERNRQPWRTKVYGKDRKYKDTRAGSGNVRVISTRETTGYIIYAPGNQPRGDRGPRQRSRRNR